MPRESERNITGSEKIYSAPPRSRSGTAAISMRRAFCWFLVAVKKAVKICGNFSITAASVRVRNLKHMTFALGGNWGWQIPQNVDTRGTKPRLDMPVKIQRASSK